ncbi:MAG: LysR family transcriptional regulator [Hyphomicrobiales bacterium]
MLHNIGLLRHFLAVVEHGNLNAAAQSLGLSQPALTKSIRRLEATFRVTLFERHARGMRLTRFGDILLRHAKLVRSEMSFAEAELSAARDGQGGELRIGAGPFWGATIVPRAIAQLQRRFPKLKVELQVGVSEITLPRLLSGDLDLVIAGWTSLGALPPSIRVEEFIRTEMQICAAKGHPLLREAHIGVEDLARYPWVLYQQDPELTKHLLEMFRRAELEWPSFAVQSTSLMSIIELLRSGPYLSCLAGPLLVALASFGLRRVPIAYEIRRFQTGAVYHRSLSAMIAVRALIDLVRTGLSTSESAFLQEASR